LSAGIGAIIVCSRPNPAGTGDQYTLSEEKTMVVEAARHRVVLGSKPLPGLERASVAGGATEQTGEQTVDRGRGQSGLAVKESETEGPVRDGG